MTAEQMSIWVRDFLARADDVQWKKNKDYHPDNVAFLEILRTCAETGITVEQDLWGKLRKQYIALRSYTINGQVESEPPSQRRIDIAVYVAMMDFWDLHKKDILIDALAFVRGHTKCELDNTTKAFNGECHREAFRDFFRCDRCLFLFWLEDRVNKG